MLRRLKPYSELWLILEVKFVSCEVILTSCHIDYNQLVPVMAGYGWGYSGSTKTMSALPKRLESVPQLLT